MSDLQREQIQSDRSAKSSLKADVSFSSIKLKIGKKKEEIRNNSHSYISQREQDR